MAVIKAFRSFRPQPALADQVAALPYDVYNRSEAAEIVRHNPLSFLAIDRAETQFDEGVDTYADCVYEKARELLDQRIADGTFIQDEEPCFYVYQLTMAGRSQTGIVALSAVDDYQNQIIKKHEKTRAEKEIDRIRHVDTTNAQTGPIFLAYRSQEKINRLVETVTGKAALYDFTAPDGVKHRVFKIGEPELIREIEALFLQVPFTYIADGHHRAASAVKVSLKRRQENPDYTGAESFNYFLSVLFPDEQLEILPYNRVVKDLNGLSAAAFLEKLAERFRITDKGKTPWAPREKGRFGMFLAGNWYELEEKEKMVRNDPVKSLDASILQEQLLAPVLGIADPRTDRRIDFVGGIRGLSELEKRVNQDMAVAFSMYPTSIRELLAVADADLLMPPKSTWFEPKLRSGLFINRLSEN